MAKASLVNALVLTVLVGSFGRSANGQAPAPPAADAVQQNSSALPSTETPLPADTLPGIVVSQGSDATPTGTAFADCEEPKKPLKWSWGGQYRILPNGSNFPFHPEFITDDQQSQGFVNQRMRVWATVNPNEQVEGYIQVQMGGVLWGSNRDFSKIFPGPVFPPAEDFVGIMLRRGWLGYQDDDWGKFRAGILDWHDSFGDTLASSDYDFNIGGMDWTKTFKDLNNFKVVLAALYLSDLPLITSVDTPLGRHTAWLYTADVDQPVGQKSSVGASVYYLSDHGDYSYPTLFPYQSSYDVWVGVRGKTVVWDSIPINSFALLDNGDLDKIDGVTVMRHTGYAGKFEVGPVPVGEGKLSAQLLYASGSSHPDAGSNSEFRTVAQSYGDNFGAEGYWSYMHITSANAPSDVTDLGVSLQDRGLGLWTVQAKYVYPLCKKLSSTSSAGWFRAANRNPASGSADIGTELAQMFTYNFGGGLTLDVGAAYLLTGDFYRDGPTGPTPDDLWEVFARLQLEF